MEKSMFYTLKGYQTKEHVSLSFAMEDYLEMIYRLSLEKGFASIKELSQALNVQPPSVSKMVGKLRELDYVRFEKYQDIFLTEKGQKKGTYLLWRHEILERFLKRLNGSLYHLEQVEKIEHFVDDLTLKNIDKWLSQFI